MSENPLISLDKLGEAANNLIDKLSGAIGWIAKRPTAERTAVNDYINDIKSRNYPPLVEAAMVSKAKKTIKEYCNQYDVVGFAIESMSLHAQPENVDDDWIAQFMNKVRFISDREFKFIWGRILTQECNEPNSIPKKLLTILEQMDKEDAEVFTKLCSMTVHSECGKCSPIIAWKEYENYYKENGITFDRLVNLDALSLIHLEPDSSKTYTLLSDENSIKMKYFDDEYQTPEGTSTLVSGNVMFTKAGEALCKAIQVEKIEGFFENYCVPFWKKYTSHTL